MSILLKQGDKGCTLLRKGAEPLSSPAVEEVKGREIVDTTGAGDCFTAAYAVGISEGRSEEEAMAFANKAAFLCIT